MSNRAAASAAPIGQDSAEPSDDGYRMQLPQLPHGRRLETTVFLHGDLRGRPYRTQDFAEALEESVGMKHVVGLGTFQYNHVLICTLDTAETKEHLAAFKELTVKGRRCVIIDPNQTEVTLRVHWLPTFVTDSKVKGALASLGRLKRSTREKWRAPNGAYEVHSSTRSVTLVLCVGVNKENLPHQASIAGYPVLLSMPGRPQLCLRCNQLGHMRRQCQAPWCRRCRGFGHVEIECVPTYAAKARVQVNAAPKAQIDDVVQLTGGLAASAEATGSTPASKSAAPSAEAAAPCKSPQPSGPGAAEQPKVTRQSQRQKPKKPDKPLIIGSLHVRFHMKAPILFGMRRYSVQKKLNWTQSPWRQCAFNDKFTMDGDEPIIALLGGLQSGLPKMVATGLTMVRMYPQKAPFFKRFGILPRPLFHHSAIVFKRTVFVVGGLDLRQAYLKLKRPSKCCFAYNLSTLQWRRIANLKLGRVFHMLVAHEGIMYAIGGQGNDDALLGSVECYDPEQDWWHVIQGHLCCPRMAAAAAVTKQGSVVIAGGATRADRASKKVYLTSDVCMLQLPDLTKSMEGSGVPCPKLPSPRLGSSAAMLSDGSFLLVGGMTATEPNGDFRSVDEVLLLKRPGEDSTWTTLDNLPTRRHAMLTVVVDLERSKSAPFGARIFRSQIWLELVIFRS
ncbi:hypothetical protein HPB47_010527 [Ixodes persulcatus]|uniref:Uncharacterized protein n=1 Tax=Ixodes persulcatus TaxID=34615 RepID=A0AC60NZ36_IXOPE|nr:hypothetical protein HPB47_010527 [Ixodes persulcatus]